MNTDALLRLFDGNKTQAAIGLGVPRRTIIRWSKKKDLSPYAIGLVQIWFRENGKRVPKKWMP